MAFCMITILLIPLYAGLNAGTTATPPDPAVLEKALDFINSKRHVEAIKLLSGHKPSQNELASYHSAYAGALRGSGRTLEAIEHLRLAYIYSPQGEKKEYSLLERAEAYTKLGYYNEASVCLKVFLMHYPSSLNKEKAHLGLADSLYRTGHFSEALSHYKKAGDSHRAAFGIANCLFRMEKPQEANDLYKTLIADKKMHYEDDELLYNIGESYRLAGKYSDAVLYMNSVKTFGFKQRANMSLGLISMSEGRYEVALKQFNSAMQSSDKKVKSRALINSAEVYLKLGKKEEARKKLIEIRTNYPYTQEYDRALLLLAGLYRNEKEYEQAVALLKELIYRRSPDVNALNELNAIVLDTLDKRRDELLPLWKSVGSWMLEPSRSESLFRIASALKDSGKPFLEICTWLSKHGKESVKVQSNLALAGFYADMGDAGTALQYLQKTLGKGEADDFFRLRAKLYCMLGDERTAVQMALKIKKFGSDEIALLMDISKKMKEGAIPTEFIEKISSNFKGTAAGHARLADIFFSAGRRTVSLKHYKTALEMIKKQAAAGNEDDRRWVLYRISLLSGQTDSAKELQDLQNSDSTLGRLAGARQKEMELSKRMEGIF